jgi:hypothetical protein
MKQAVPYYSQFFDVSREDQREKSCSIVCLKMAFDFLSPGTTPSIDHLIEEASFHTISMKEHGLITEKAASFGTVHDVLVSLAHNYGVLAYREEFKSLSVTEAKVVVPSPFVEVMLESGIKKIVASLETGSLVIASVFPGLSEGKSFHTILLIGFEDRDGTLTGFYYHDPDARTEARNDQFIALADFVIYWRKMAVFLG